MFECKFCETGHRITAIYNGETVVNRKIYENTNFYVTVSIGALTKGHILIIPQKHYLSMGILSSALQNDLSDLVFSLRKIMKKVYRKSIIAFEHGTGENTPMTSASVVHAHLHLLPIGISLLNCIQTHNYRLMKKENYNDFRSIAFKGKSYLLYQDIDEKLYSVEGDNFESQLFRKLICNELSLGDWDWRNDYREKNVIETVNDLITPISMYFGNNAD